MHPLKLVATMAAAIAGFAAPVAAQPYPNQDIQGVIQWGAGGPPTSSCAPYAAC